MNKLSRFQSLGQQWAGGAGGWGATIQCFEASGLTQGMCVQASALRMFTEEASRTLKDKGPQGLQGQSVSEWTGRTLGIVWEGH